MDEVQTLSTEETPHIMVVRSAAKKQNTGKGRTSRMIILCCKMFEISADLRERTKK
jgi:hypothetical protein